MTRGVSIYPTDPLDKACLVFRFHQAGREPALVFRAYGIDADNRAGITAKVQAAERGAVQKRGLVPQAYGRHR
jgi:hypothetical protein